jgi:hypothetical protein
MQASRYHAFKKRNASWTVEPPPTCPFQSTNDEKDQAPVRDNRSLSHQSLLQRLCYTASSGQTPRLPQRLSVCQAPRLSGLGASMRGAWVMQEEIFVRSHKNAKMPDFWEKLDLARNVYLGEFVANQAIVAGAGRYAVCPAMIV